MELDLFFELSLKFFECEKSCVKIEIVRCKKYEEPKLNLTLENLKRKK